MFRMRHRGQKNIIDEREHTIDFSVSNIRYHQSRDDFFSPIVRYLQSGELPEEQRAQRKILLLSADYLIYDGMLFYLRKQKSKRVMNIECAQLSLPSVMGNFVLQLYHESVLGAHCGLQFMIDLVKERYFFP